MTHLEPRMTKALDGTGPPRGGRRGRSVFRKEVIDIYVFMVNDQDAYSLSTTKSLMTNPLASLQRSENMLSSNATL